MSEQKWTIHGENTYSKVVKCNILEDHSADGWYLFRYCKGQGVDSGWVMGRRIELFYDTKEEAVAALTKRLNTLISFAQHEVNKYNQQIEALEALKKELTSGGQIQSQ